MDTADTRELRYGAHPLARGESVRTDDLRADPYPYPDGTPPAGLAMGTGRQLVARHCRCVLGSGGQGREPGRAGRGVARGRRQGHRRAAATARHPPRPPAPSRPMSSIRPRTPTTGRWNGTLTYGTRGFLSGALLSLSRYGNRMQKLATSCHKPHPVLHGADNPGPGRSGAMASSAHLSPRPCH